MPQMTLTAEIQPEQMGQRLDQTLAELFPEYSRSRLKTWIEAKQVKMNGEIADIPRAKVYGGEQIEISVEVEDENRFEPQNIPLNIVYEDDDIIVINKPKDLVVHPGAGNPDGTTPRKHREKTLFRKERELCAGTRGNPPGERSASGSEGDIRAFHRMFSIRQDSHLRFSGTQGNRCIRGMHIERLVFQDRNAS